MLATARCVLLPRPHFLPTATPLLLTRSIPRTPACARGFSSPPPPPPLPRPWPGLRAWRRAAPDEGRAWGPLGPCRGDPPENPPAAAAAAAVASVPSLAELAALVLSTPDPLTKSRLSHLAFSRCLRLRLPVGAAPLPPRPARPPNPPLVLSTTTVSSSFASFFFCFSLRILIERVVGVQVSPKEVPAHRNSGLPLNAYMLHNLAHVELNAIDLAWDTVARFAPLRDVLGDGFFADFARVADDESRHFAWCSQRLAELGFSYGDMPAHNLLWRECEKSSGDVSARLAVIPLVQEARGLDAGPRLVQKLIGFGDHRSSDIVAKIAEEEVAHVAVGVYWFDHVCRKMGRIPCHTFKDLLDEYGVELKGPFNYSARDEAGIPREWYDGTSRSQFESDLSKVHERLACIVAMEKENSSLNG